MSLEKRTKQDRSAGPDEVVTVVDGFPTAPVAIPSEAQWAVINVSGDPAATNPYNLMRFTVATANPTASVGTILGDNESREIPTRYNLLDLKFIGIRAGEVHEVTIQYFY